MNGIKNNEINLCKGNFSNNIKGTLKKVRKINIFLNQTIPMKKKMITTICLSFD